MKKTNYYLLSFILAGFIVALMSCTKETVETVHRDVFRPSHLSLTKSAAGEESDFFISMEMARQMVISETNPFVHQAETI